VPVDHINVRDTFTFEHKLRLKKLPSSDSVALIVSNWIASVGKRSDGAVLIVLTDGARRPKNVKCETILA
jgi:hypothetical protein